MTQSYIIILDIGLNLWECPLPKFLDPPLVQYGYVHMLTIIILHFELHPLSYTVQYWLQVRTNN
jgi:hypothetical protein